MNYNYLCEKLDSSTYLLNIYQDGEFVETGTGVCINSNGDLITAAHVIYGRLPARKSDTENLRVFGKGSETKIQEYEIAICGVSVNNKELGFSIDVDLALLKNTNPNNINYNYLPLTKEIPVIGDNILMSGFSDEIDSPFNAEIRSLIGKESEFYDELGKSVTPQAIMDQTNLWYRFSMIKSGMVGRVFKFTLADSSLNIEYSGANIYIDNAIHSGASGGAIINTNGDMVGLITHRARTTIEHDFEYQYKNEKIKSMQKILTPSGTTIGTSPHIIAEVYNNLKSKEDVSL